MTRPKSRPDLDAFHAHLDALKLFFIREHYPTPCAVPPRSSDHLSVRERLIEGEAHLDATAPSNGVSVSPDSP